MAKFVFTDASVTLNSVDLSDHVNSVTIDYSAAIQEDTSMGDTSVNRLPGLKDFSITIEWRQDYAASNVDATMFPLVGAAAFAAAIRPASAAVSATNPEYQGNVLLESYNPIGGSVGDVAAASTTFQGDGDLTRATA